MKRLSILVLSLICAQAAAKSTESINKVLSQVYTTKTFARGKLEMRNIESNENFYLYYDGSFKQVSAEDGHYTIEINNPDKLNIIVAHPDSISIKTDENEKNKILGLRLVDDQFQFFALEKEDRAGEDGLSEWKIKESELEKGKDGYCNVPPNTLIVPIYNKQFNLELANVCWKSSTNSTCLPTITINGSQKDADETLRKACWLHLKIGQMHSEQKSKRFKEDNREISFLN